MPRRMSAAQSGQSTFAFAEDSERPEVECRACGGRTRFRGRTGNGDLYECSDPGCGLVFSIALFTGRRPGRGGVQE
jgi:hypothetical protein